MIDQLYLNLYSPKRLLFYTQLNLSFRSSTCRNRIGTEGKHLQNKSTKFWRFINALKGEFDIKHATRFIFQTERAASLPLNALSPEW